MKTMIILKKMALPVVAVLCMMTASCSSDNDTAEELPQPDTKDCYVIPVTINASRGDDATRTTYVSDPDDPNYRKLTFSGADMLLIAGADASSNPFSAKLTYVSESQFSGTLYSTVDLSGKTLSDILADDGSSFNVYLLPDGFADKGYYTLESDETPNMSVAFDPSKGIAPTKAEAIEQFSDEWGSKTSYDAETNTIALRPRSAIINCNITDLTATFSAANVTITVTDGSRSYANKSIATSSTFAFSLAASENYHSGNDYYYQDYTGLKITVSDGETSRAVTLGSRTLTAGKVYNLTRTLDATEPTDLSMVDCAGNARSTRWTANSYMVHTAGDYKLPLVYGNAIKNGETNAEAYTGVSGNANATPTFPRHDGQPISAPWIKDNGITVASAELLWQDAPGLITEVGISGDYLTLHVGKNATSQEGNAVIAVKDGSGTIVWSWHIWLTRQTFEKLTSIDTGSQVYHLTPVNIGWVGETVGMGYCPYYQWGRKDALLPSKGIINNSDNHTVYDIAGNEIKLTSFEKNSDATIADNIQHPAVQFRNEQNEGPCTTLYLNMWDAQSTSAANGNVATATRKTVYDPCPPGFCVPTGNLFIYLYERYRNASIAWGNRGVSLPGASGTVFFPAAGNRNYFYETIYSVGGMGYYWSASVDISSSNSTNTLSFSVDFDNRKLLNYSSFRAYGYFVRAVAESLSGSGTDTALQDYTYEADKWTDVSQDD